MNDPKTLVQWIATLRDAGTRLRKHEIEVYEMVARFEASDLWSEKWTGRFDRLIEDECGLRSGEYRAYLASIKHVGTDPAKKLGIEAAVLLHREHLPDEKAAEVYGAVLRRRTGFIARQRHDPSSTTLAKMVKEARASAGIPKESGHKPITQLQIALGEIDEILQTPTLTVAQIRARLAKLYKDLTVEKAA